ncbi:aminotransferase class V-fold PLP-dependent enzyme [Pseudooceanicola sediminis]|uniref:Aminotransferase class V-fold PLP-dependent enzyme n=1 Tax=Pseudooceanicola sediminis TaxID=2211117 RepID=A0A399IWA8_9RHOB|nr:aminotransferase class V-fold PLP-dependent enzyme [Pseudooceanicola sediminis]KAA2312419.1 aminotransferase class V-fold PLP-dependent enzyme [Puniceibacterium sp. HSS470]RII37468.1 aminotransferase class V-fold PLP-dependent enzyme [Pseudooceanicola sediminis]|tara:strand:+ start:15511 stop:16959 length:1449 start_codon:yes stop_codon:yes gene_type:complete
MTHLARFRASLERTDILDHLRDGLIGRDMPFDTPYGTQRMLYADYVASGRALRQVEDFVAQHVLPWYANSHTEASACGEAMTRMREEARTTIARLVNAGPDGHVIFAGSGATAGLNRIARLLQIEERVRNGDRIVVIHGPYEHHSNILPWRESGAEVLVVRPGARGGVDLDHLESLLKQQQADLIIGSFSAASNVTGILTDPDPVTRLLKAHDALAIWDYAGGAPYLPMDMTPTPDAAKDAIVFSAHKFPGGPGASGVAIVRDSLVQRSTPTVPGGGTVTFVSPWRHNYSPRVEAREEAGTPNVVGDIRAALVMLVKDAVGSARIVDLDRHLRTQALSAWSGTPQIDLLERSEAEALPILSFRVQGQTGLVHHQLFTRMLSDLHGIQVRGGCACAGPYAHQLLGIDEEGSDTLFGRLSEGHEMEKPGWVRLNLSWLHSEDEVTRILQGVADLARDADTYARDYTCDPATARFRHHSGTRQSA